ncbi:MAG: hypothetical protein Q8L62_12400 [Candidatus Nitrotoga sp.]|nr:hypothetical protein [Candidatus Nitrotoga sp.]
MVCSAAHNHSQYVDNDHAQHGIGQRIMNFFRPLAADLNINSNTTGYCG